MAEIIPQTFPYFEGQSILYVHGFASSGQTGTARLLATMLPSAHILSPDLPIEPLEVLPMLREIVVQEQPALVLGTSMGGMFAEQLYGMPRILVNPAFEIAETIRTSPSMGLGRHPFLNPRKDGAKDFLVTKRTIEEFREVTAQSFSGAAEERSPVFGLFGRHDPVVHTEPLFAQHYRDAVWFEGEHRLNESILLHAVMPIIQRIDDLRTKRKRPSIFIELNHCLRKDNGEPVSESAFAVEQLARAYDVYVVFGESWHKTGEWFTAKQWADERIGVSIYNRFIISGHKEMLLGDYLIDTKVSEDFMGTSLCFGKDPFKTWRDVLTYFERLGGQ